VKGPQKEIEIIIVAETLHTQLVNEKKGKLMRKNPTN